ncbi:MAG TPA: hypothetical protein VH351_20360 [Bryobacteraceae bacterium]|nr:hypothetical protein [Bryobacteraceae bacterium]
MPRTAAYALLTRWHKTDAVLATPSEGAASSLPVWRRAAALLSILIFSVLALWVGSADGAEKAVANVTSVSMAMTATTEESTGGSRELGESYSALRPEQKRLVDDLIRHYNATTGSKLVSEQAYDNARLSVRTTFDAVTHALLNATMTDAQGNSLGRAIDLVEAVDQVMGEEAGASGDHQFRLYMYLKPNAVDLLSRSQEFFRDRDNATYHKGFPISYRLKKGPPSIQISVSRDHKLSDIDIDYRSSGFPKALVNGHLSAANSDVRAGNNLDRHDSRWSGLNGWWRNVFGLLGTGGKPTEEGATERLGDIPLSPGVKADQGVDRSAHDFLQRWVVAKQPNQSVAYFARRSYPCLDVLAQKSGQSALPGTIRVRTMMAMQKFSDSTGSVNSVADVFEPADKWSQTLKPAKNAYASEFRLMSVPADMAPDEECVAKPDDDSAKPSKDKYFATAFRGKGGDSRNKVMSLLWAQESGYWKIIAIRVEDSGDGDIVPSNAAVQVIPSAEEPQEIAGDPGALTSITEFYQDWIIRRNVAQASAFASKLSYECLAAPSQDEKKLTSIARIQAGLEQTLAKMPSSANLSGMMSSVQPLDDLLRPVRQENSQAFAMMGVPDQIANSFLCQNRQLPEAAPELNPADATYGAYYLTASRLNYGEEESPALLLLWTKEGAGWKIVAWAVELP